MPGRLYVTVLGHRGVQSSMTRQAPDTGAEVSSLLLQSLQPLAFLCDISRHFGIEIKHCHLCSMVEFLTYTFCEHQKIMVYTPSPGLSDIQVSTSIYR